MIETMFDIARRRSGVGWKRKEGAALTKPVKATILRAPAPVPPSLWKTSVDSRSPDLVVGGVCWFAVGDASWEAYPCDASVPQLTVTRSRGGVYVGVEMPDRLWCEDLALELGVVEEGMADAVRYALGAMVLAGSGVERRVVSVTAWFKMDDPRDIHWAYQVLYLTGEEEVGRLRAASSFAMAVQREITALWGNGTFAWESSLMMVVWTPVDAA